MDQLKGWFVALIGILLLLPLVGVSALGTVTSGIGGWITGLLVLAMGVMDIIKK